MELLWGLADGCAAKPSQCQGSSAGGGHSGGMFSSLTGQCEAFSRGPLSTPSIVALRGQHASPHPHWLISMPVFLSPEVERQTRGLVLPWAFLSPLVNSSALQVLREVLAWVWMGLFTVASVYEGRWRVRQHSKSCCQRNDVHNCSLLCQYKGRPNCIWPSFTQGITCTSLWH